MMRRAGARYLTLAVHANGRGMGWIAVSGPFALFSWGTIATRQSGKNEAYFDRIVKLLDRLDPHTLVLEAFDTGTAARQDRVVALCAQIVMFAEARRIAVHLYTFDDVLHCIAQRQRRSREEIAHEVVKLFPEMAHLLPRKRNKWQPERLRMNLFCAAAVTIAHHTIGIGPRELF